MAGRECYHCKQWIEEGDENDCWTTTETALRRISEEISGRLGAAAETAAALGGTTDLRFAQIGDVLTPSRDATSLVRPDQLPQVCVFLGRTLKAPQVRRVDRASKHKIFHIIQIRHRDEVEAPITDWLREAYELSDTLASKAGATRANSTPKPKPTKKKKAKAARKRVAARKSKRR
jgi:hypothetical protein